MTVHPGGKSERGDEEMGLFTVAELREVISVKVLAGDPSPTAKRRIRGISTDSRSVRHHPLEEPLYCPLASARRSRSWLW